MMGHLLSSVCETLSKENQAITSPNSWRHFTDVMIIYFRMLFKTSSNDVCMDVTVELFCTV